ncbi:hypothetical protein ALC53_10775 [Atta colombica]|uniref:Uncharacterized protein n=1 Tax=Atta colombica TaxID=520822 RepID=A0A195B2L6_9HYME|nr:hypothetical protein ALC53_10775 [Atta colombica]
MRSQFVVRVTRIAQFEKNPTRSHNTRISLRFTKVSQDNHSRWTSYGILCILLHQTSRNEITFEILANDNNILQPINFRLEYNGNAQLMFKVHTVQDRNELCQHSLVDSAFSMVVPRPNAVSQGRRRRVHRPTMTGRRSRRSCLFETSTSSSDREMIQLSDNLRALRTCQNYDQPTETHKNIRLKKFKRIHVFSSFVHAKVKIPFILYPACSAKSKRLRDLCIEQSLASLHLINIICALHRVHENLPMEAATVRITVQIFNVGNTSILLTQTK